MQPRKRDPEPNALTVPVAPLTGLSVPREKTPAGSTRDPRRDAAQKAAKDRWAQWATRKAL